MHLYSIRSFLAHLKPTKQLRGGKPEVELCKKALTYLWKNLKIVSDPFGKGVYWNDVLMNKKVAKLSLNVSKTTIEYLYAKTFKPPFGNNVLNFHLLRHGIGKYKKT